MARPKLVQKQVVAISKILEAHCSTGADGIAVYENGWDDERVTIEAQRINPVPDHPLNAGAVANLRKNTMGRVRKAYEAPVAQTGNEEAADLKRRLDLVEKVHARMVTRWGETRAWIVAMDAWAKKVEEMMARRGYTPPAGRPQSTPPDVTAS